MTNTHASPGRAALRFSIHGLSARDETLFKSYLRLLDHRTEQHWEHQQDQADVRVVADGVALLPGDAATAGIDARWQLTVGATARELRHFVCVPFRADQLESELNILGALVMAGRAHVHAAPPATVQHAVAATAGGEMLRLLRWPSAAMLQTPERLRLATLMSGRPFTAASLIARAGHAADACAALIADLRSAGLLVSVAAMAQAPAAAAQPAPATRANPVAQPGLLARIRSRLGMSGLSLS